MAYPIVALAFQVQAYTGTPVKKSLRSRSEIRNRHSQELRRWKSSQFATYSVKVLHIFCWEHLADEGNQQRIRDDAGCDLFVRTTLLVKKNKSCVDSGLTAELLRV